VILIDSIDGLSDSRPLSPETKAAMARIFAKVAAWAATHPDRVPRIPHFKHTCMDPHCQRRHDPYPLIP
jgi:hypothetical protein